MSSEPSTTVTTKPFTIYDFQTMKRELSLLEKEDPSTGDKEAFKITAWRWLESKGAGRISYYHKYPEFVIYENTYPLFTKKLEEYNKWKVRVERKPIVGIRFPYPH